MNMEDHNAVLISKSLDTLSFFFFIFIIDNI